MIVGQLLLLKIIKKYNNITVKNSVISGAQIQDNQGMQLHVLL